jgi:hypothetical protein
MNPPYPLLAALEAVGDFEADLAGGNVETEAVQGLHASEEGVLTVATGVDGGAGIVAADLQAGDIQAESSSDEAGGVGTGPAIVGLVAKVPLGPGGGELAKAGQGHGALVADDTALGVLVGSKVLLAAGGDDEADGLVAVEEAVDAAVRSNLVVGDALVVLIVNVLDDGEVLVLLSDVGLDKHHVAAIVVIGTSVALVGNLLESSTLLLIAAAELGVGGDTEARAAGRRRVVVAVVGGRLGLGSGRAGAGRLLGGNGNLDLLSGGRGGRLGGSRRGGGAGGGGLRRRRLLVHDELVASLERSVSVPVAVTTGVSRHAQSGGQKNGNGDLHDVGLNVESEMSKDGCRDPKEKKKECPRK